MKNKPKFTSRPKKQPKSALKKTPSVKVALSGKKKKLEEETGKNKIGHPNNAKLHKMERELRETKERLRLLSEAAEEGIAIHDKGVIIDANDALARIFGYELSEMIGMNAERFATPESWKVIQKHISQKYNKTYEAVGIRKDGSSFICSLVGKPYKYKGRTLRLSTFRDITERKQAEEKLRSEEQRFRALAEQSSDIIVFVNREGIVTYENPAVERSLGLKAEERIGVSLFDRIHPDDLKIGSNAFNTFTLNTTFSKDINSPVRQIRLRHHDGSWRTFETTGIKLLHNNIVEGVIINLRDITERKQAENDLRKSEIQFRTVFEVASVGIVQVNPNDGRILKCNETFCQITGYSLSELLEKCFPELTYPEDRERDWEIFSRAVRKETHNYLNEKRYIRKDGSIIWVKVDAAFIRDSNDQAIRTVAICEDITERKKAYEKLQNSESNFRLLAENAPDAIFIRTQLKFAYLNKAALKLFGVDSPDQVIGQSVLDRFHPDSRDSIRERIRLIDEQKISVPLNEQKYLKLDGTIIEVEVSAVPFKYEDQDGSLVFVREITERKKAEKDLHESEELFRNLFQCHAAVKLIIDPDTGNILDANESAVNYYGWTREQITQMKIQDINMLPPEEVKAAMEKVRTRKKIRFEFCHRRADGSARHVEIFSSNIEVRGRDIIHSIVHDITERKNAEKELKKYREQLEELVRERTIKLEASNKELEAFSYSASHDLRAPLRTIEGFSQALLEDCEDKLDIQGKDYLIRIRAATRRMAELIEDLLQLSRITRTETNMENVNLTRIAQSIIDELQKSQPQRHVEIRIADVLEETADSKLMHIVLENLLGNAWKFTEKQATAVIEFGCTKEGKNKVYFIRDNGVGFDMAYADKLFVPFQRLHTEEEFPGTGIGLATVRRIIHRHGGKVWTEGATGKGATFYFSLNEK